MNPLKYQLILASNSPRRKQLLQALDLPFQVRTMEDIDEIYPATLPVEEVPLYLARQKAAHYLDTLIDSELLITADTIVACKGDILGKPADARQAKEMLHSLSGCRHQVITGVALTTKEKQTGFSAVTQVSFNPLTEEDIDYYVDHYKPLDKAGAYGIQEWIGHAAITHIEGSYFNVVGLPVARLYEELKRFGAFTAQ